MLMRESSREVEHSERFLSTFLLTPKVDVLRAAAAAAVAHQRRSGQTVVAHYEDKGEKVLRHSWTADEGERGGNRRVSDHTTSGVRQFTGLPIAHTHQLTRTL